MKWPKTFNLVNLSFYLALILITAINAFSLWNTWKSLKAGEAALHTYEIRNTFQSLFNLVQDAVNSQRNYLAMTDEQFLIPYHEAVADIKGKISHLRALTRHKPWYQERLQTLEQRIHKELDFLKKGMDLTRAGDSEAVKKLVESGEGCRSWIISAGWSPRPTPKKWTICSCGRNGASPRPATSGSCLLPPSAPR